MATKYVHVESSTKIKKSNTLCELAKKLFKEKKYHQSLETYEKSFKCLLPSLLDDEKDEKLLKREEMIVLSNICACKLKINDYRVVIEICKKIIDNSDIFINDQKGKEIIMKCYYRKGIAEMECDDNHAAVESLEKAVEMNKESKLLKQSLQRAIEGSKRHEKREKKFYGKNLLNVVSNDDNKEEKKEKEKEEEKK